MRRADLERLLFAGQGARPLRRWYAEPLDPQEARYLLHHGGRKRFQGGRRHAITIAILTMIGRYWLGRSIERDYRLLQEAARDTPHGLALTELVYGQLLMSRKTAGAMDHLDRGFRLANRIFAAGDYFPVRKRHQLLRYLTPGQEPAPPQTLRGLLMEALVIQRLEVSSAGRSARRYFLPPAPTDTLG